MFVPETAMALLVIAWDVKPETSKTASKASFFVVFIVFSISFPETEAASKCLKVTFRLQRFYTIHKIMQEKIPSVLGRALPVFLVCYCAVPQRSKTSKILGEAIRAERIKAGLSQEQLAEKADLARNYIGNIERAEYKVTVETLARIAKALNLRVSDLTRDI